MTQVIDLTLPFPPSVNHMYMRTRQRVIKTDKARAYTEHVILLARLANVTAFAHAVALEVWIYLYPPRAVGDVDNYNKSLLDSLQSVAYVDDNQIKALHVYLKRRKRGIPPHVRIRIAPLGEES